MGVQVIEAALEDVGLKQKIFADLEAACRPDAILSTNTSTIDISLVGAKTKAADRIVGAHFFSPAHIMPLLEIVRTPQTSKQARRPSLLSFPSLILLCVCISSMHFLAPSFPLLGRLFQPGRSIQPDDMAMVQGLVRDLSWTEPFEGGSSCAFIALQVRVYSDILWFLKRKTRALRNQGSHERAHC